MCEEQPVLLCCCAEAALCSEGHCFIWFAIVSPGCFDHNNTNPSVLCFALARSKTIDLNKERIHNLAAGLLDLYRNDLHLLHQSVYGNLAYSNPLNAVLLKPAN